MTPLYLPGGLLALFVLHMPFWGRLRPACRPEEGTRKNSALYRLLPDRPARVSLDVPAVFPAQEIKKVKTEEIGAAVRRLIDANTEKRGA